MAGCEELIDEQETLNEPLFDKTETVQTRGRQRHDDREALNEIEASSLIADGDYTAITQLLSSPEVAFLQEILMIG